MKVNNDLKSFLGVTENVKEIRLGEDENKKEEYEADMEKIKILFNIALDDNFIIYFDGAFVREPYDGYEFETEEEEFYYNNGYSSLVFQDENGFKARFLIKNIKDFPYERVYKVVEKAVKYTKAHPEVSKYKLY